MEAYQIEAAKRSVKGKKVKVLRREGRLPAVIYGKSIEALSIELDTRSATAMLYEVGLSTLIDIKVGKETHKVLIRDVQVDAIRGDVKHIDFLKVDMDVVIRTSVPIELVGEAPAVKELGGVLVTDLSEIEVEALPADLPENLVVDLSVLTEIDSSIHVYDLKLGKSVTLLAEPEALIARVIFQAEELIEEDELEDQFLDEPIEPELIERGRGDDDEDED